MMDNGGQCVMTSLELMMQTWPVENSITLTKLSAMLIEYFLPAAVIVILILLWNDVNVLHNFVLLFRSNMVR